VMTADPQPGAVSFRIGLVTGEAPAAAPLFTASFTASARTPITLEVTEVLDAARRPFPYVLPVDKVEVGP